MIDWAAIAISVGVVGASVLLAYVLSFADKDAKP